MIDLDTALEDFGLNSLIMWGLRNWIFGNFRADLDLSKISDAASITSLASMVLDRSKLIVLEEQRGNNDKADSGKMRPAIRMLPSQPLSSLLKPLEAYLETARPFCSEVDLRGLFQR